MTGEIMNRYEAQALLDEMRGWVSDAFEEDDLAAAGYFVPACGGRMTDGQVWGLVKRYYDGGTDAFIRDARLVTVGR
jgi:hypothetical protein